MRNIYASGQPVAECVKDLLSEKALWFAPGEPLHGAVDILLDNHKGAAGVLDRDNRLLGMVTDRQVLRYIFFEGLNPMERMRVLFKDFEHFTVHNVMIEQPVCLPASTPIEQGLATITKHGFRYMPVVDDGDNKRYRGVVHVQELHMATREKYRQQLQRKDTLLTYFMHGDDYGGLHQDVMDA